MSTSQYIALAAGSALRYQGFYKEQLTTHDGQMLKERLAAQFPGVFFVTEKVCPVTSCACDTFIQTEPFWDERVAILLSDVFYTDDTADRIKACHRPVAFFSDTQDIFAISFERGTGEILLLPAARRVMDEGGHNNGRLWEMYRKMLRVDHTVTVPPPGNPFLELVSDETQDFDTPEDYLRWRSGKVKNAIYQPKGNP